VATKFEAAFVSEAQNAAAANSVSIGTAEDINILEKLVKGV
jgi:hypothetical protein